MKITYRNTFKDLMYFQYYHYTRMWMMWVIIIFFIWATTSSVISASVNIETASMRIFIIILLELIICTGFLTLCSLFAVLVISSKKNRTFLTEHTISLSNDHLSEETLFNRTEQKWLGIMKVSRTNQMIFVYVSQHAAHLIPRRAFVTAEDFDKFYNFLKCRICTEPDTAPNSEPAAGSP